MTTRARAEALIGVHLQLLDGAGLVVVDEITALAAKKLAGLIVSANGAESTQWWDEAEDLAFAIRAGLPPQTGGGR